MHIVFHFFHILHRTFKHTLHISPVHHVLFAKPLSCLTRPVYIAVLSQYFMLRYKILSEQLFPTCSRALRVKVVPGSFDIPGFIFQDPQEHNGKLVLRLFFRL